MAESEAGLREILASEILDKIQKGEDVEYDNVSIIGDLDLRTLNPRRDVNEKMTIDSEIRITKCQMRGFVNFESTIIWQADFSGTKFFKSQTFWLQSFLERTLRDLSLVKTLNS